MNEFSPGLAGVVAVETEIAEPDREGGELRYRGVNIEDLVGKVPFEKVWGLLVDESLEPGLPAAYCELEYRTGGYMSDLQAALSGLSGKWQLEQLIDIDDDQAKEDLRRLSAAALSIVAQSARGADKPPIPQEKVMEGETAAERFLLAWRGEVSEAHAKAIDTYWICTAEHGLNASTFTARIVASTGADCGAALSSAVGALSGPLHGGAPARVLPMLDAVAEMGDAEKWVSEALARKERIMGFGHRIYRAEDPRSRLLKKTAKELGSPRVEAAERARAGSARGDREEESRSLVHERRVLVGDRARRRGDSAASCTRRCSPARAPPAGPRTSSSKSGSACSYGRRRSTWGRELGRCRRYELATLDPPVQPVRRRSEWARPPVVPGARRVEREVEVEDERVVGAAEIGALHRVEQVAAGAVGLARARLVAERQEDPASVRFEPVQLEARAAKVRECESAKARCASSAARDLERRRLDALHDRFEPEGRVVREVRRLAADTWRLRMRAVQAGARRAPTLPCRLGIVGCAHLGVERENPAFPVKQRELVHVPRYTLSVA